MIESIFIAMSGMQGHQRGLNVISNNVSNMNTAGFRGSTPLFADVFMRAPGNGQAHGHQIVGGGLNAARSIVDTRAGEPQTTARSLDLLLNGFGFFVVQDEGGAIRYTRDGSFDFNEADELVTRDGARVLRRDASGDLVPITIADLKISAHQPTSEVSFKDKLSSADADDLHVVENVNVYDAQGRKHTLKIEFRKNTTIPPGSNFTRWDMRVFAGEVELAMTEVMSIPPLIQPTSATLSLQLAEGAPQEILFNFETMESDPDDTVSSVSLLKANGYGKGTIATMTFDERGVLKLTYSNGEKAEGAQLVLAQFANEAELVQLGNTLYEYRGSSSPALREAGDDLKVVSGVLERSNVDLTEEFSELILMQRGYQASSQVVSTANEMLQELLQLRGRR